MLDDAPWTWGYKWTGDAYEDHDFFDAADIKNHEVYYNVYDQLDDSPVTWHITEVTANSSYNFKIGISLKELLSSCSRLMLGSTRTNGSAVLSTSIKILLLFCCQLKA